MENLSLDAREILSYLNELGFRNITAEQLKEFMQDLRKLIKYEERLCVNNKENQHNNNFDNLYKAFTVSFKAKTKDQPQSTYKKATNIDNKKVEKKKTLNEINVKSKTNYNLQTFDEHLKTTKPNLEKPLSKKSVNASQGKQSEKSSIKTGESRMWIRTKPVKKASTTKTKDPVQLYQYYQREWEKFKQNLPGENDHSELRWKIRHKLLGIDNN